MMNNQEIDLRTKWTRINMFKHIRANWIHPCLSASAACQHQMFNHPSTSGHGTHPNGPNPPTVRWPACRHGPHGTLEVPNWNPTFKIGVRRWKRKNAFQPLHSVQTVDFFIFKVRTLHVYNHYRLKFHCFQPLLDLWSQAKWNNLEVKTCKKSIIIIIIITTTTSHNNDNNDNNDNNNNIRKLGSSKVPTNKWSPNSTQPNTEVSTEVPFHSGAAFLPWALSQSR